MVLDVKYSGFPIPLHKLAFSDKFFSSEQTGTQFTVSMSMPSKPFLIRIPDFI